MMLSPAEIDGYREDGYVIPEFRLPPGRVSKLRGALDRVIAANPDKRPEQLVSIHIDGKNAEGVCGDSEFLTVSRDPAILDMVEQCIGPDIVLWGCQAFC